MSHPTRKSSFVIATCMTALGITILVSLGVWQVQRLGWKENIISSIQAQQDIDAATKHLSLEDIEKAAVQTYPFVRGFVEGEIDPQKILLLKPRTDGNGNVGGHVIGLLHDENLGRPIVINFGWISEEDSHGVTVLPYEEPQKLIGNFRAVPSANFFTPPNFPQNDRWSHIDIVAVKTHWDIATPLPLIFYSETNFDKVSPTPKPFEKDWIPPNNHQQYAFFWFTMAGILIAIYTLRFLRSQP